MYIQIYIYNHHRFKGGTYPKCKLHFQGVFEGGVENVNLHFEGILKTLPTKRIAGGRSATSFTCKGGPKKCILHFGMVPP